MAVNNIKLFYKYHEILRQSIGSFFASIFFGVMAVIAILAVPMFIYLLLSAAVPFKDAQLISSSVMLALGSLLLFAAFALIAQWLQKLTARETRIGLSELLFKKTMTIPGLMERISNDTCAASEFIAGFLPSVIANGLWFAAVIIVALLIDIRLGLAALLIVPFQIFTARICSRTSATADSTVDPYAHLDERIDNMRTVRLMGREMNESSLFGHYLKKFAGASMRIEVQRYIEIFIVVACYGIWAAIIVWYLCIQVSNDAFSAAKAFSAGLLIFAFFRPSSVLVSQALGFKNASVSLKRIYGALDHERCAKSAAPNELLKISKGDIALKDVPSAMCVTFPAGTLTALVGMDNANAAKLVDQIVGLATPLSGTVIIDDKKISEYATQELREKIGVIEQESLLFDGTVMENILYGNEERNRGDAMWAARQIGAHNFIENLPGGYDAAVGQGGHLLSASQRRQIAIARMLLREPKIIIFDERGFDDADIAEYHIKELFSQLRKMRTVIIMTDRLSTMRTADNIYVLEDLKFIESGTYDVLIAKKNAFYRYYWRRFGGLADFIKQTNIEIERVARYGSKFSAAVLMIKGTDDVSAVNDKLRRSLRIGDNCTILENNTIVILLPEIDAGHLKQFFDRMLREFPEHKNFLFVGTEITKKTFGSAEELIAALVRRTIAAPEDRKYIILDEFRLSS